MPICPVTKKCDFTVVYSLQNTHFSPPFCARLTQEPGRQTFNTWDLSSAYIWLQNFVRIRYGLPELFVKSTGGTDADLLGAKSA